MDWHQENEIQPKIAPDGHHGRRAELTMHFTIRDLLWLTLVVAMGVTWWAERQSLSSQLTQLKVRLAIEKFKSSGVRPAESSSGLERPLKSGR